LDVTDHFAAGRFGFEHLPNKTLEGQAQAKNPPAAVGALRGGREQRRWQKVAQMFLKLAQSGLADGLGRAAAQGGQTGTPGGEVGCLHKNGKH